MKNFGFVNAKTVEEAVTYLGELGPKAYIVAGGTNVMVDIRDGRRNGLTLVNIRDIAELKGISMVDGQVRIGALATISALEGSDIIRAHAPCLAMAASVFADPTTRNSATIGGNLMKASTVGDTLPSLMILEAQVHVRSIRGERAIPIQDVFVSLGKTSIQPDELVTHFTFAPQPHSAYLKIGRRKSMAIAMSSAAVYAAVDEGGRVTDCRIALGAVAPVPVRAYQAEKALLGIAAREDAAFAPMYEAIQQDMAPKPRLADGLSAEYRRQVIPVLVKRALRLAAFGCCE